ncbi:MAG: hypothetical protein H6551_08755 [Chitinophagales bacterium]|nr:hypothetical protein [Chitinophagaceae bacterium]MCB9065210.1 hypothetical protein [Chitinophagales bacterium]
MKKLYIYGLIVLGFAACKPNIEPDTPQRGDADFSNYLAVGNSTSAGYTDGSLYVTGQQNSFPNILAKQFRSVGGGEFRQPLVRGEHGWPVAKKVLGVVQGKCDSLPSVKPTDFKGALDTPGTYLNISSQGPFNNQGVPGIKAVHYGIKGYAMLNPFAGRMFTNPATTSALDQIIYANYSFFTLWVGSNDVLSYASSGGDQGTDSISLSTHFGIAYDSIMNTITRNGSKGVVLTIPSITDIPFFRAISPKGLAGVKAEDANKLNLAYNGTQVHFEEGDNYFVIQDAAHPNGFRQITQDELVCLTLPIDSVKCAGWGTIKPIPGRYVLTRSEIDKVNAALVAFNGHIQRLAAKYQIPVLVTDDFFLGTRDNGGYSSNGINFTLKYVSGGIFSLDGIHLTGKGNALLANFIIDRINAHYGSSIPHADPNSYEGIRMP